MKTTNPLRKAAAGLALLAALTACSEAPQQATPKEPGPDTACSLDGMILKDFPGPKAQIHYAEGAPEFFCDVMEVFATVLAPEQKRPVAGIYVQDMGKTSWEHPEGNWIDARKAVYVIGSKKHGSMGPTLGSFSTLEDAQAFVQKEGGKVVRFEEVTLDMLNVDTGAPHDNSMH